MLQLLIIEPGQAIRRQPVGDEPVTVGSLALCTVALDPDRVEREHLELSTRGDGTVQMKVLARCGTVVVNGAHRKGCTLRRGDVVDLGGTLLVVDDGPVGAVDTPRDLVFATSQRIFELVEQLVDEQPISQILVRTLDVLMVLFGASRALLLGVEGSGKSPRTVARRGDWPPGRPPRMSRTLFARMQENPVPMLVADVATDPSMNIVQSISMEVRTVVAGPLVTRGRLIGVVYMESPVEAPAFGEPERRFLQRFCQFAGKLLTRAEQTGELKEERERLLELHNRSLEGPSDLADLIGESDAMHAVKLQIRQVAPTDLTALVLGESGTGKELVARAIHRLSGRSGRPFVALNCTALPEELVESELFGHVTGAFTGAQKDRLGRFELASGGTLFLDEVGDLSPAVQGKLLRALQERVIQRVGEGRDRPVDVRIVAATNAPLSERIRDGRFREDLFFRLSVFTIEIPPLRERLDDVPRIAGALCRRFAAQLQRPVEGIDPSALAVLGSYSWPGNVRELANVIQQAVVRETTCRLTPPSFSFVLGKGPAARSGRGASPVPDFGETFDLAVSRFELWFLERALKEVRGEVPRLLEKTGLSKASFYRKCAALGLEPARFRRGEER